MVVTVFVNFCWCCFLICAATNMIKRLETRPDTRAKTADFGRLFLSCFLTNLDEIHDEKKDFIVLFKMAPSTFRNDMLTKLGVNSK